MPICDKTLSVTTDIAFVLAQLPEEVIAQGFIRQVYEVLLSCIESKPSDKIPNVIGLFLKNPKNVNDYFLTALAHLKKLLPKALGSFRKRNSKQAARN